jgi:putative DNA primase/helicase
MPITIKIVKKTAIENNTTPSDGSIATGPISGVKLDAANNNTSNDKMVQAHSGTPHSDGADPLPTNGLDGLPRVADDVVLDDAGMPIEKDAGQSDTAKSDESTCEPRNELRELPGIVDEERLEGKEDDDPRDDQRREIELTEDSTAKDLVDLHGGYVRFDHDVDEWFYWGGKRWIADKTGRGFDLARLHCREHRRGNRLLSTRRAIDGVEKMARCDQRIAVTSCNWDRDPWLLGTPEGEVDLRTGELRDADPAHFITKLTRIAPAVEGAPCPEFKKFLDAATNGDAGVQRLLQQFGGYSLTGLTFAQVLLFIYGPGGNGKTVLQNVFREILGDYAVTAAMETFAASKQPRHLTELAMLQGARLVGVSETEKGQKWAEARINLVTGGDPITANRMRQDHFTYVPQFKLLIVGNHKPQLGTVNDAARRRFIIVPFLHKPAKPDAQLMNKLRAEYPAVLRWMIDGCIDWSANGISIPDVVKEATSEYFEEQDLLGRFLAEKCVCSPELQTSAAALFEVFKAFAIANGENPGTSTSFGSQLAQHGLKKKKSGTSVYLGIGLKGIETMQFGNDDL